MSSKSKGMGESMRRQISDNRGKAAAGAVAAAGAATATTNRGSTSSTQASSGAEAASDPSVVDSALSFVSTQPLVTLFLVCCLLLVVSALLD